MHILSKNTMILFHVKHVCILRISFNNDYNLSLTHLIRWTACECTNKIKIPQIELVLFSRHMNTIKKTHNKPLSPLVPPHPIPYPKHHHFHYANVFILMDKEIKGTKEDRSTHCLL